MGHRASDKPVAVPLPVAAVTLQGAASRTGVWMQFDDLAASGADAAPASDERNIAEQRRLEREGVEAVRVLVRIDTVHQERHARSLAAWTLWVQRKF